MLHLQVCCYSAVSVTRISFIGYSVTCGNVDPDVRHRLRAAVDPPGEEVVDAHLRGGVAGG